MIDLTDSHAHLADSSVYQQIDAILQRAQAAGVKNIINICTDAETLERGLEIARKYPFVRNVASTTPHDVQKEGESFFPIVEKHAKAGDLVAIGETGLDYHYTHSPQEMQRDYLRKYLQLALEVHLPVVIHCRDAFADFFDILDSEYTGKGKGVLHCFTGTLKEAEEVFKRGWYLSLSGIVTYKKSDELREVARMAPLDQLLIETDTPFLAPQSHRGKPNEPAYMVETAKVIADIKGISINELASVTSANTRALFSY